MSAARVLCAAVALCIGTTAQAQLGCSGARCTVEITMPVNDVLRLTLSTTSVPLGTPGEADYAAGFRDVSGTAVNVTAKSNRAFRVDVAGTTTTFGYSGTLANPAKPASDLLWATSAAGLSGTTTHMGATANLLNRGAGTVTQPMFLRTLWSFTRDVPGAYSLGIRLTVSAP